MHDGAHVGLGVATGEDGGKVLDVDGGVEVGADPAAAGASGKLVYVVQLFGQRLQRDAGGLRRGGYRGGMWGGASGGASGPGGGGSVALGAPDIVLASGASVNLAGGLGGAPVTCSRGGLGGDGKLAGARLRFIRFPAACATG